MELDTKCVACNRLDEDGSHLFFKCKYVEKVWQKLNIENFRVQLAEKSNAKEVMRFILSRKKEEQVLIAMLLWMWWQERNKIREGDRRREAMKLAYIIQKQASEMLKEEEGLNMPSLQVRKPWRRPPSGVLKINPWYKRGDHESRTS
ncbi:hypothetical protein C2845_PM01G16690 [Panicum miliaceum]|uniref:Reverse transcriptase zinc-binding domain-containing protein n=1 Tax=Panicum miliaceum TaxID=4540 RepID=A0A3L6TR41_PANMI|nr:hypothetical protein C2845_PM01G16690 [Panicum miliaceum]